MDKNFDTAVSRTAFEMDRGIKYLQAQHVTTKNKKAQKNDDLVGAIKTIASEWRKEKNSKWINPWSDLTQPLAGSPDP
jgi:kynureninase